MRDAVHGIPASCIDIDDIRGEKYVIPGSTEATLINACYALASLLHLHDIAGFLKVVFFVSIVILNPLRREISKGMRASLTSKNI